MTDGTTATPTTRTGENVRVELFASALKKTARISLTSDPFAIVTLLSNNTSEANKLLGKTEVIRSNLNPKWKTYFDVIYDFTTSTYIHVAVKDARNSNAHMGSSSFELGEVLVSKNNTIKATLRKGGYVAVRVTPAPQDKAQTAPDEDSILSLLLPSVQSSVVTTVSTSSTKSSEQHDIISTATGNVVPSQQNIFVTTAAIVDENKDAVDAARLTSDSFYDNQSLEDKSQAAPDEDSILSLLLPNFQSSAVKTESTPPATSSEQNDIFPSATRNVVPSQPNTSRNGGNNHPNRDQLQDKQHLSFFPDLNSPHPSDTIPAELTIDELACLMISPLKPLPTDDLSPRETAKTPVDCALMPLPCSCKNSLSPSTNSLRVLPHMRPTFFQYLAGGCEVELTIAIDFTASNGDPRNPWTLHHIDDSLQNDYEKAITAVGSIIARYDSDQKFPVFGFGAKFNGEINHCFHVGSSSELVGISGVLEAYRKFIRSLSFTMSSPTVFSEVINVAAAEARKTQENKRRSGLQAYRILLILTDGDVTDIEETKKSMQEACDAPLSIVIVGIGSANFSKMQSLDDFGGAEDSQGRDICKFVEFSKYRDSEEGLTRATLSEIPDQLVDYFYGRDIMPIPLALVLDSQMSLTLPNDTSIAHGKDIDLSRPAGSQGQIYVASIVGTECYDYTDEAYHGTEIIQDDKEQEEISEPLLIENEETLRNQDGFSAIESLQPSFQAEDYLQQYWHQFVGMMSLFALMTCTEFHSSAVAIFFGLLFVLFEMKRGQQNKRKKL